jgi:hypothetical protein
MKIVKTVLVSIVLVLSGVTSAQAMGDREKGALMGAGAVLLLPTLIEGASNLFGGGHERTYTTTTYVEPRPTVVYREPYVQERVIIVDRPAPVYYDSPRPHHHHHHDGGYYPYYR